MSPGDPPPRRPPRLAVLLDPRDEDAPSMDLSGEQLVETLRAWPDEVEVSPFQLRMPRLARAVPRVGQRHAALNADRLIGRFLTAEMTALYARRRHDLFHVVDHVYAHLVLALPAGRAGVYCHDLDAFRSVLQPAEYPKPAWFRTMTMATLRGVERAAVVFHSTEAVGAELLAHDVVEPARLVHAPYGVGAEFGPVPGPADRRALELADTGGAPYLLHVGSALPRKRIDVLLEVFAQVRSHDPDLLLVQQGASFDQQLRAHVGRLGLADAIRQPPRQDRNGLAALYRNAAAVLVTSESEGFGLPVIEALACGALVVASDIPVLREVGGEACLYCPVGDVRVWATQVVDALAGDAAPPLSTRLTQAAGYSWTNHARIVLDAYRRLVS